ncbi:MAG: hypothetical protein Q8R55_06135 [Candidatus Taylorbacteria bacterium]|nr:hypothetical protein [Candidatus Taylorbacteria bacterium]
MITKKSLLMAISLLMAVVFSSLPNTASASVFDWILRNNIDYKSQFLSFAGIDQETGFKIADEPDSIEKPAPLQFFNSSAVMAMNVPMSGKKTASKFGQKTYIVPSTAYSSTVDQTDDTPFITAMGTHVRDGVVAANFLPFGTIIKIPDYFGDKTFIVEDRMNKRYDFRIDLWFSTRQEAKQWGIRTIKIEIVS